MFYKASGLFFFVFIGILYLSGENFRFLLFYVILVSGVCLSLSVPFSLIGCVGSVGISLASRAMNMSRVCVSVCGVPGRYEYIWALWWCGRRDCTDFLIWLCSGGYSTGEMVRGGGPFFLLLSSVCCQFSWRLDICGRVFVLYIF